MPHIPGSPRDHNPRVSFLLSGFGGGGSSGSTTTTTKPPQYVEDQIKGNLEIANTLAAQPYQPYGGQRIADPGYWTQYSENQTINQAMDPNAVHRTTNSAGINAALTGAAYQPQMIGAAQAGTTAMNQNWSLNAAQAQAAQLNGAAPSVQANLGLLNPTAVANAGLSASAPQASAATMGAARDIAADQITAGQLAGTDLNPYLNSFTQNVIDTTLADMSRTNNKLNTLANTGAVRAGAYGGSRATLLEAENNRNLMDRAGAAAANLNMANFTNAQGQATNDINRRLTAAQSNQSANLAASQSNQSTEANRLATNAGFQQQVGLANQAAQQARDFAATEMANQTSQFNAGQANSLKQYGAGLDLTAQQSNQQVQQARDLANLSNLQQIGLANQAATNAAQQYALGLNASSNQFNAASANEQARFNAGTMMTAQQANQNASLDANQQRIAAGQLLSQQAADTQRMQYADLAAIGQSGAAMDARQQNALNLGYADYLAQQQYPLDRFNIRQSALMGTNAGSSTTTPYFSNTGANALGGALGGAQLASMISPGYAGYGAVAGGIMGLLG
ncbi:hypothetical protein GGE65_007735 [Skermanella aerolata]|uniref:hypothetical protein n=1 Tax=Skermanella aerolata TaxID=393310 RepID=UPI003D1C07C9